jgi:hypothetical protein
VLPGPASFAGLKADRAASVVYVVDASGAMVTSLSLVIPELERSIARLSPAQKFQVVLFRDRPGGSKYEVYGDNPELIRATAANKAAVAAWLASITPIGRSNPLDGLHVALSLKPDAIFLLSRSIKRSIPGQDWAETQWGRGKQAILAELDRINPTVGRRHRRRVLIKTIQFLEDDPSGIMQAIAEIHGGGDYRVLTLEDLQP